MKNQFLKQSQEVDLGSEEISREDFTGIYAMVDELLNSLDSTKKRKRKLKSARSPKKRERKSKKFEDLGIRDLPFTF